MSADLPYPGPPQKPEPRRSGEVLWQAVSRVALFGVGAVLTFLPDGSDVQVTAGSGLMLASAGFAIARGLR